MATSMTLLFMCLFYAIGTAQGCENKDSDLVEMVLGKQSTMEKHVTDQTSLNRKLQRQISSQQNMIKDSNHVIDKLQHQMSIQQSDIENLKKQLLSQQKLIEKIENSLSVDDTTSCNEINEQPITNNPEPDVRNQYQALGCMYDTTNLSCANGSLITITKAYYGQYLQATPCNEGCCAPNPGMDCTESMAENDAGDWAYLKYSCDNKTQCSYVYEGAIVNDCELEYIADYMMIIYSCHSGDENNYVAFSAHAATDRNYKPYDIVLFDSIITNTGNHYNSNTSTFLCPFDGVYSFSVSFYSGGSNDMRLEIMRDNENIVIGYADYDSSVAFLTTHAMSTVVIECKAGQKVWTRCGSGGDGVMFNSPSRDSHFSGFALHRFS